MVSTISEYKIKKHKIFEYLGGKCIKCGSHNDLQIDHIDHNDKTFCISKSWGLSWERLLPELHKCQLLCKACHLIKTKKEGSLAKSWTTKPQNKHGTVWQYSKYKCRCDSCKKAKSNARKQKLSVV